MSGTCRWCEETVTGNPVLPNARFQDLVVSGEGCERRAHWLRPVEQPPPVTNDAVPRAN